MQNIHHLDAHTHAPHDGDAHNGHAGGGSIPQAVLEVRLHLDDRYALREAQELAAGARAGALEAGAHSRQGLRSCEINTDAYLHHIDCRIELEGDLTPEQAARVREIAMRCPVGKTLTSEIRIVDAATDSTA